MQILVTQASTVGNLIRVPMDVGAKSFVEALIGSKDSHLQQGGDMIHMMRSLSTPRYEGGNLIVDLDEDEYIKGVENLKFSAVWRIFLKRGASLPHKMDLKSKLGDLWGIQSFKLVLVGSVTTT